MHLACPAQLQGDSNHPSDVPPEPPTGVCATEAGALAQLYFGLEVNNDQPSYTLLADLCCDLQNA